MYVMKHGGHHIPNQCLINIETRAAQKPPEKNLEKNETKLQSI